MPTQNTGPHGFGRAIIWVGASTGDAVVIMMADESDDAAMRCVIGDILNEGWDCVFGSRFIKGGGVIDYPRTSSWSTAWRISSSACCFAMASTTRPMPSRPTAGP